MYHYHLKSTHENILLLLFNPTERKKVLCFIQLMSHFNLLKLANSVYLIQLCPLGDKIEMIYLCLNCFKYFKKEC